MAAESAQIATAEFTNANLEVLFSEKQIHDRIAELGGQITRDYAGKELVLVSVLKGSCVFLADLMRAIDLRLTIDFMSVSSYKDGTKSTGDVEILKDLSNPIRGKEVLVVEGADGGEAFVGGLFVLGEEAGVFGERQGGEGRPGLGQRAHLGLQPIGGDDAIEQSQRMGLGSRQRTSILQLDARTLSHKVGSLQHLTVALDRGASQRANSP